jgi:hypothetical protein
MGYTGFSENAPEPDQQAESTVPESKATCTRFVYRPHWFVLSQTEGKPYQLPPLPACEKILALATLSVQDVPFARFDGNTQGYAQGRTLAMSTTCGAGDFCLALFRGGGSGWTRRVMHDPVRLGDRQS